MEKPTLLDLVEHAFKSTAEIHTFAVGMYDARSALLAAQAMNELTQAFERLQTFTEVQEYWKLKGQDKA